MRASGGKLSSKPEWEAGGESNAAKEAEEKKRGGKVHHKAEGDDAKGRADKRARGGKVHSEHHGQSHSMHIHHHKKDKGGPVEVATRARGGHVAMTKHAGQEKDGGAGNHAHEIHEIKHHSMKHNRGRARGGRIGADKAPLTTAAKVKHITPGEVNEHGVLDLNKSEASIKG